MKEEVEVKTDRRSSAPDVQSKLAEHTKDISLLGQAIEELVSTGVSTNSKLDKLTEALSTHNVLTEKVHNLDRNVAESFQRRDDRLAIIEKSQRGNGCPALRVTSGTIDSMETTLTRVAALLEKHEDENNDRFEQIEAESKNFIKASLVQWVIGGLFTAMLVVYQVTSAKQDLAAETMQELSDTISDIDKKVSTSLVRQEVLTATVSKLESNR